MATMGESGPRLSVDDFARLYESVKNWGRWGAADQRGTLNYVTRERTLAAAALVRSGRTVSLSLPLNTVAGPDNPRPALHYMTHMGDREPGEPGGYGDFIGLEYHGNAHTHDDALCHATYRGQFYNGVPASSVTSAGAAHGAITIAEHGVVTRGVLLDIPRWNFHWQGFYYYKQPLPVSGGDIVHLACSYDNSAGTAPLMWGEKTSDEMCLSYFYVTQ